MNIQRLIGPAVKAVALAIVPLMAVAAKAQAEDLLGAGASFPHPLYSKMFDVYNNTKNVAVNYQAIGSGGGQRQILNKTVDFGASDAFMSDEKLAEAPAPLVHVPICLGAVAVSYNIPGNPVLKISQEVLADIFLGKITQWDDPKIKELNQSAALPKMSISVVHRSDGSGTTSIFTDFLAKISSEWKEKVGHGKSVNWPAGLGAKGNSGVAGLLKQVPGSIGYVELTYALTNNMPQAEIENNSGNYIAPTIKFTSLAANAELPDDTRVSITDTNVVYGYPIAGFTWLLLYKEQNYDGRSFTKAKQLVDLVHWMVNEGQTYASPLHYVPLSDGAKEKAEKILKSITYDGKSILG